MGKRGRKTSPESEQVSFTKRQQGYIPTEIDMALSEMEDGAYFVKVKSSRWRKTRHIQLSRDHLSMHVRHQSCGSKKHKLIDIKKLTEIRVGYQSPIWENLGRKLPPSELCFSLVIEDENNPLNLVAVTPPSAQLWIKGLQHLNANLENLDMKGQQLLWTWEHFKAADKDNSNSLSVKEVKKLLDKLNFAATSKYVDKHLQEFDKSGDSHLSFEEFTDFFKKITWRPEIERLYKKYCDADLKLQPKELVRFLQNDQGMNDVTNKMALELIDKFEPDEEFQSKKVMSIYGFTYLLMSPVGDVFNHKHRQVVMDMTQPLSSYFIASSHNTYLTHDQLFGKSSVEAYIRALEKGCRCVELDAWDGDDDEPIIYHGYTLTSKIKFADVIEAVRDYGFKASSYPVILSLENHCSVQQQNKMAEILKNTLGSKLLTAPVDPQENTLPSPEQLKGKVLVKGKRLPKESESDGEVSEEDEAADVEENGVKKHQKSKKNIKLSRALSECVVYAVSRHFNGFADAEARSDFHHISSLNEDKAEGLAKSKPSDFVKHNQWQLVRIYPKGSRTNSSNYNPLSNWNVGCQIVALNYQTEDEETYLNQARFRSNGEAGYVLKPPCLLEGNFDPINITKESAAVDPTSVKVTVISAQQLPKPPNNENDVIDPYVVVSVFGVDADRQSQKTSVIEDNGFNPMWMNDQPMEFNMLVPSLAFLEFKVMDKDSKGSNDLVGLYTVAVQDIAQGYRHVHLETKGIKKLTPATLFVHIEIENKLSGTGF
ncbi:unnamed protein product [Clavelina lepadiformis]|uniref:Phosphoinositide phospholipase C n=2 Tax=Clavelina lepadiformis TaxID=159417 RepID=A0ABP0F1C0_CLALP